MSSEIVGTEYGMPHTIAEFRDIQKQLEKIGFVRAHFGHPIHPCPICGASPVYDVSYVNGDESISFVLCAECWHVVPVIDMWGDPDEEAPTDAEYECRVYLVRKDSESTFNRWQLNSIRK